MVCLKYTHKSSGSVEQLFRQLANSKKTPAYLFAYSSIFSSCINPVLTKSETWTTVSILKQNPKPIKH